MDKLKQKAKKMIETIKKTVVNVSILFLVVQVVLVSLFYLLSKTPLMASAMDDKGSSIEKGFVVKSDFQRVLEDEKTGFICFDQSSRADEYMDK